MSLDHSPSPLPRERYRSVFLRSELWKKLREERLVRDDYLCQGCATRSNHHDAHHIYYPRDWNQTRVEDLRTLCRECHVIVEFLTAPWTVRTREEGKRRFSRAIPQLDRARRFRQEVLEARVAPRRALLDTAII